MGRGRAKAKQTKVARELKYYTPDTDLSALEQELRAASQRSGSRDDASDDTEQDGYHYDDDQWAANDR
ncbi:Protein of unknown function [Kytococcus aerolatus]|uniref:DUF3073 domain-containing protein n=1 Tax=Kytococcus aerolatus TaxID=592308 RepID=A0A212U7S0_9MICO|nr:DUF3073 domain-containing protein [Kytococcus aerolatus]SNC74289.1 Protein of unknown function [Kytococcus aerolatus]